MADTLQGFFGLMNIDNSAGLKYSLTKYYLFSQRAL
jgi:hypothetical protein